jgi:F-type H+-transporting ATPase subunit b
MIDAAWAAEQGGSGMPQFQTEYFSSQLFWAIISFIILFYLLNRFVFPVINRLLDERAEYMRQEIEELHNQRKLAEELKDQYSAKLEAIDEEMKLMFDETERRIYERRHQLMDEWRAEMERRKRDFREDMEIMQQQVVKEIRNESAEFIVMATENLIHQHVKREQARQVLEKTLEEFEHSVQEGYKSSADN